MLVDALEFASWILAAIAALPLGYLLLLTLASVPKRAPPRGADPHLVAIVPAHDEERGIASTVASLLAADYPAERRSVLVVADNCIDRTAERARDAGAMALERFDPDRRGKGYALEFGFAEALRDPRVDGVLVVDADTIVAPNVWRALADRLSAGAGAVQAANRVRNRDRTWRTRMLAISLAMINGVRCLGRERLGLSVGLKGNGMAFSRATLRDHPYRAFGVVEDVEHAVALGLAGVRVEFAPETYIASESPETAAAAVTQRRRWEGGRLALLRTTTWKLLRAAIRRRSLVLLDLGLELVIPPLTYPALLIGIGVVLETAITYATHAPSSTAGLWAFSILALVGHVARGWWLSGTGARGIGALFLAPIYVSWKLGVARPFATATSWVRTVRVAEERERRAI